MNEKLIEQVAKVIGKNLAIHELSIVDAAGLPCATDSSELAKAFTWSKTPVSYTHLTLPTNREV